MLTAHFRCQRWQWAGQVTWSEEHSLHEGYCPAIAEQRPEQPSVPPGRDEEATKAPETGPLRSFYLCTDLHLGKQISVLVLQHDKDPEKMPSAGKGLLAPAEVVQGSAQGSKGTESK